MALGSTQAVTEMSNRCFSWGKGGRCIRLATFPPSCAIVMKSGNLNFLEPSGPIQACNGTALPFYINHLVPNNRHTCTGVLETPIMRLKRQHLVVFVMQLSFEFRLSAAPTMHLIPASKS
jgi:hypothetical protein